MVSSCDHDFIYFDHRLCIILKQVSQSVTPDICEISTMQICLFGHTKEIYNQQEGLLARKHSPNVFQYCLVCARCETIKMGFWHEW